MLVRSKAKRAAGGHRDYLTGFVEALQVATGEIPIESVPALQDPS
jgi:hypothetical protein